MNVTGRRYVDRSSHGEFPVAHALLNVAP